MRKIKFDQTDKNFIAYVLKITSEGLKEKTIEKDLSREEWAEFVGEIDKLAIKFEKAIDEKIMTFTDDEMDMLCNILQRFVNVVHEEFENGKTNAWDYAGAISIFVSIENTLSDTRFELFKEEK
jgi:hypothetical protein